MRRPFSSSSKTLTLVVGTSAKGVNNLPGKGTVLKVVNIGTVPVHFTLGTVSPAVAPGTPAIPADGVTSAVEQIIAPVGTSYHYLPDPNTQYSVNAIASAVTQTCYLQVGEGGS